MGLDSVALLVEFEEVFQITISDNEAEKIYYIEDASEVIFKILGIEEQKRDLFAEIFQKTHKIFRNLKLIKGELALNSKLSEIISKDNIEPIWGEVENQTQLTLPRFSFDKKERKIFGITIFKPKDDFFEVDLKRFIDCICCLNYKQLIDIQQINSKYEIACVIVGITSEFIGVPVEEIYWKSSFTNDLGID